MGLRLNRILKIILVFIVKCIEKWIEYSGINLNKEKKIRKIEFVLG